MLIVVLARFRLAISVGIVLATAACSGASSTDTSDQASTSSAITLDGIYKAEANGAYAWSSFHDGHYALWSGSAACAADDADGAMCSESGTFTLDATGKTATLTPAGGEHVHELQIDVLASGPLVGTESLNPMVGLVGTGASLVSSSDSSLVANQFSAKDSGDGQLVHQVNLRSATFGLLSLCSIAMFNPADKKVEAPIAPAQITQSCGGKK